MKAITGTYAIVVFGFLSTLFLTVLFSRTVTYRQVVSYVIDVTNERWMSTIDVTNERWMSTQGNVSSAASAGARGASNFEPPVDWHSGDRDNKTLIVMFTTIKNLPVRELIHNNTLANWGALKPWLQPVLFLTPGDWMWEERAKTAGWDVRQTPALTSGLPVVRSMYEDIMRTYDSHFYSYSNAEILYDWSLRDSLAAIHHKYRQDFPNGGGILVVGRRTNVNITEINTVAQVDHVRALWTTHKRFHGVAQEYFITTRHGFPWSLVPPFVVGRVGYDNWMVAKALAWDFFLVDATTTMTAIHQCASDGVASGWKVKKDKLMNYRIIGTNFDYSGGSTQCCPWCTSYVKSANTTISVGSRNLASVCKRTRGSAVREPKQKNELQVSLSAN